MTASVHDITRERIRRMPQVTLDKVMTLHFQETTLPQRYRGPSRAAIATRVLGSAFAGAVLLFFVLMVVGK